jgi:hypothetical protein
MEHFKLAVCVIGVVVAMLARTAQAQQFPIPQTAAQVPGPPPGTANDVHLFNPNPLNRYSPGTKNKNLK